jgi:hypothetical protein
MRQLFTAFVASVAALDARMLSAPVVPAISARAIGLFLAALILALVTLGTVEIDKTAPSPCTPPGSECHSE